MTPREKRSSKNCHSSISSGSPAGKPDEVPHDGIMSVRKVVRHLAKGSRYVIRVMGDSMQPRI